MSHYDYIMLVHLLICHRRRRRESWLWHNKNFFFQFLVQNCDIFDHEKRKFFGPKLRYFLVLNFDIFWSQIAIFLDPRLRYFLDPRLQYFFWSQVAIFFGPGLQYFFLGCDILARIAIFRPSLGYYQLLQQFWPPFRPWLQSRLYPARVAEFACNLKPAIQDRAIMTHACI